MESKIVNQPAAVSEAVLYVLRYYALFKYPLTANEIFGNCSLNCTRAEVEAAISCLVKEWKIFEHKGFYSPDDGVQELVVRRLAANKLAETKIPKAMRIGRMIASFPFVRFVGISGSLSKGYADASSDFDFFIVTAENRLWISRTILHLFKKLTFIFFQEHKFCMNYFLDTARLELEERNIYTAIELATLVPVAGGETGIDLQAANKEWASSFLPNEFTPFCKPKTVANANGFIKRMWEKVINPAGNALNYWLMKITDKRWRKKWGRLNYPEADYNTAFKTTLHHSKNHPANYQKKVLAKLSAQV